MFYKYINHDFSLHYYFSNLYIAIMLGGHISGGHFNPAVSIMMSFSGKLSRKDLPLYLLSQILGGLSAWYLFTLL